MKLDINRIKRFVEREIWHINLKKVGGVRGFGIRLIRTFVIAWRGFKQDDCQLKASALTFYTLLSVVPVIAMFFGVAKGFGFEKKLESEIKSDLSYNQEVIHYIFDLANNMLDNTKGGLIAGLGIVVLFWSVMKVLGNIEQAFNEIWEIKRSRNLIRKFSDYLSIMLVTPVFVIISGSLAVYIGTHLESITQSEYLGFFGPVVYFLLNLAPLIVTTMLMMLVYMILPNTKVSFSSAFFGAFLAAILIVSVEWIYLFFQVGVSKYNAIYGGFAALPLFLIWVHTNWTIVLLGAELSFAYQNQSKYEFEVESNEISFRYMEVLALEITRTLVKRFVEGAKPLSASELSEDIQMPSKLVRKVIQELVRAGVISESGGTEKEGAHYQPAIDIAKLDVAFVLKKLIEAGINEMPVEKTDSLKEIESQLDNVEGDLRKSGSNVLLKDM